MENKIEVMNKFEESIKNEKEMLENCILKSDWNKNNQDLLLKYVQDIKILDGTLKYIKFFKRDLI